MHAMTKSYAAKRAQSVFGEGGVGRACGASGRAAGFPARPWDVGSFVCGREHSKPAGALPSLLCPLRTAHVCALTLLLDLTRVQHQQVTHVRLKGLPLRGTARRLRLRLRLAALERGEVAAVRHAN